MSSFTLFSGPRVIDGHIAGALLLSVGLHLAAVWWAVTAETGTPPATPRATYVTTYIEVVLTEEHSRDPALIAPPSTVAASSVTPERRMLFEAPVIPSPALSKSEQRPFSSARVPADSTPKTTSSTQTEMAANASRDMPEDHTSDDSEPPASVSNIASSAPLLDILNTPSPQDTPPLEESEGNETLPDDLDETVQTSPLALSSPEKNFSSLPRLRYAPAPVYPEEARWEERTGVTTLSFRITAEGEAQEISVLVSSGHEDLDSAAISSLRSWRFANGHASAWYRYTFRFEIN